MSNQAQTKYFDLHLRGIGYVNRIREVKPKKGDSFWACSISALRGTTDAAEYTNVDCRISGSEAQALIRRCAQAVEARKKVLIGFTIGDIYPETFTFEKGEKKGETGVCLKGHLLFVSFIKVDGKEVYKAEAKAESKDAAVADTPVKAQARPTEPEAPDEAAQAVSEEEETADAF